MVRHRILEHMSMAERTGLPGMIFLHLRIRFLRMSAYGLSPNTSYRCSVWVKTDTGEQIQIGVNGFGGTDVSVTSASTSWTMVSIPFTTGSDASSATVYAYKKPGTAYVYVDDFGVVEQ